MTVEDAYVFFENIPKVKSKLEVLKDVGLGYMKLGQSAPTLSGGEASRVKLAKELQKKPTGRNLLVKVYLYLMNLLLVYIHMMLKNYLKY